MRGAARTASRNSARHVTTRDLQQLGEPPETTRVWMENRIARSNFRRRRCRRAGLGRSRLTTRMTVLKMRRAPAEDQERQKNASDIHAQPPLIRSRSASAPHRGVFNAPAAAHNLLVEAAASSVNPETDRVVRSNSGRTGVPRAGDMDHRISRTAKTSSHIGAPPKCRRRRSQQKTPTPRGTCDCGTRPPIEDS